MPPVGDPFDDLRKGATEDQLARINEAVTAMKSRERMAWVIATLAVAFAAFGRRSR